MVPGPGVLCLAECPGLAQAFGPPRPRYGRGTMWTSRLLAALPVATTLLLVPPAAAQDQVEPVGGPLLSARGTVVHRTSGLPAFPRKISARGWLVADLDSGDVLAARDPHGHYAPASTLKVLTAITLLPRIPPSLMVRPSYDDVAVDGTRVGLVEELSYPADELFASLLMTSANDSAGALATASGGMTATAALMNAEAERLQARDTHAVNTSGLDAPGQTSSPYDLALLARSGLAIPEFRRYVGTRTAGIRAPRRGRIEIYNHNKLLQGYRGALGVKNGYTTAARASFVGAAQREGRTLVVALMRADPGVHREAAALLDWGFAASRRGVQPVGRLVDPVEAAAPSAPGAAVVPLPARAAVPAGAAASPVVGGDESGLPGLAGPAGLAALAVAVGAVLLRRRQVLSRRRERRAARLRRTR